jgi:diguanylate cyclase (GGDEF)-like protein
MVRQQDTLPIVVVPLGQARPARASNAAIGPRLGLFGQTATVKRPLLLMIVLGFFLIVVGVTAVMLAATASSRLSVELMNATVTGDAATVRGFANAHLLPADLTGERLDPARQARLESLLGTLVERGGILRSEIRMPDGTILVADRPGLAGSPTAASADMARAIARSAISASIVSSGEPSEAAGEALSAPSVLRAYLPIIANGRVQAVFGIWRDAQPILGKIESSRNELLQIVGGAGLISALVLFLIFGAAQRRIVTQTKRLVEAERRDALTDSPNHGAVVALLAASLEQARTNGAALSIAIVDLDNFRLLNESHGHDAGNTALVKVADLLRDALASGGTVGRYGPDEFLLVAATEHGADLVSVVEHVRRELQGFWIELTGEERLPVTISAAIASFPEHGQSLTALLSTAARTLEEAKVGGGDAIQVAGTADEATAGSSFDVLQGLVLAIDTKDRYTKRHSDDVGRYGAILAELAGLEPDLVETVRRAGLLHDVGKIGIPDAILRKPSALTPAEYDVVKQHVALGDMMVRDAQTSDLVRLGIRHHHERWDGGGYLDRLAGEEIPLVARILAVGDAFSAMTTTRPYRKALPVQEAIRRLGDAAGTQLDERLVRLFVDHIEEAEEERLAAGPESGTLWTPGKRTTSVP